MARRNRRRNGKGLVESSKKGYLPHGMLHLGDESWATCIRAHKALLNGTTVTFVGIGQSMHPFIPNGTRCIIAPVTDETKLEKGMAVFCKIGQGYLLHKIRAFRHGGRLVLIGNNHGHIDGWTARKNVFGVYTGAVE